MLSHSRGGIHPSFAVDFLYPPIRGRRESRVRAAPAISCAKSRGRRHTSIQVKRRHPAFPARWVTAYFALSPATGFLATVIKRILPQNLAPASGRQDHTTSPSVSATLVSRSFRVHRISPRVRDDRDPPLSSGETRGVKPLICPTAKAEYFQQEGWTYFR